MNEDTNSGKHTVNEIVKALIGAGENPEDFKPSIGYQLTNYVEWIVAHKTCGKPLTGMSPQNGWCMCLMSTGKPPEPKEKLVEIEVKIDAPSADEVSLLKSRCEVAEKEVAKLIEKLDKASKKIAELVKGKK